MANAKRWISGIHCESQELIDEIICSQSDSSEEQENKEIRNRKKIKLAFPKSNIFQPLEISSANSIEEYSPRKDEFSKDIKTVNTEVHQDTLVKSTMSSPKNMYELGFNSPILKRDSNLSAFDLEHDSPILASTYSYESLSPVITNMEKLKRIQDKMKNSSNIQCEQPSPDLFHSQATQIIEQNVSPDYITQKNSEQLDTLEQIDIISSQDSSSITVINPSSSSNSSSVTDLVQCYHQPNPKKKYYKKGGLLHQLKTVINLQTSRISLWHHDIYLKNVSPSTLEHINCFVKNKWKDFGCHILECCKIINGNDLFLVCLGNTMNYNSSSNFKQLIKLFPPYKKKIVNYKNKETEFFYNISKVLTDIE